MDEPVVNNGGGNNRPPQRIDTSLLSGNHQWITDPEVHPSFYTYVEINGSPRNDMARYKTITLNDKESGKRLWSSLCGFRTLCRIPETLKCDRTFTRDVEEAYYLDMMDNFLRGFPELLTVAGIPLVCRSFQERLFYKFNRRGGYMIELYDRRRLGRWLPFDAFENKHSCDVDLCERYPRADGCVQEIDQPPALPVPAPLVAYYYHTELQKAQCDKSDGVQISERARRLLFCLEHEYPVLFLATWWNEAYHGGRQFILTERTLNTLTERCSLLPDTVELKPVQVILEYMRSATTRSTDLHCWLAFNDNSMEESTYVIAKKLSGEHDPGECPVRRTYWVEKEKGRILMTQHSARLFKRSTVLEKKLTDPDLDKIPGLLDLVRSQRWTFYGNVSVGEMLSNMLRLYSPTQSMVDTFMRQGITVHRPEYPPRNDRYITNAPDHHRVGYYNDEFRNNRVWDSPYRDRYYDDRRNNYLAPPCQDGHRGWERDRYDTRYGNERGDGYRRGGYRDLDGEAAARHNPDLDQHAQPRSPVYHREEVYELPDQKPRSPPRYNDGAGPSNVRYDDGAGPSNLQEPAVNNAQHQDTQRSTLPAPSTLARESWGTKLFEAARKDAERPAISNTGFRPSTPFKGPGSRGNTPRRRAEFRPEEASKNATTANNNTQPVSSLSDTDFMKLGSGNMSWGVQKKRTTEDAAVQPRTPQANKKARVESRQTAAPQTVGRTPGPSQVHREGQDPVLTDLYARHPKGTAEDIAKVLRSKKNAQNKNK